MQGQRGAVPHEAKQHGQLLLHPARGQTRGLDQRQRQEIHRAGGGLWRNGPPLLRPTLRLYQGHQDLIPLVHRPLNL